MYSMMLLFISLLFAHLLGDFVLQTKYDVLNKDKKKVLLKHTSIIAGLSWLLSGMWTAWTIPLLILVTHYITDSIKTTKGGNSLFAFLIDQLAHITSILITVYITFIFFKDKDIFWIFTPGIIFFKVIVILSGMIIILRLGAFMVPLAIEGSYVNKITNSYFKSGMLTGQVERIFIFSLILIGYYWAAIAILIAKILLKNVFAPKTKFSRMLKGTLVSFMLALITAILCNYFVSIL